MHGSPLVAWLLVALSTATAVSCLLRSGGRGEAAMGLGMAVMALPVLRPGPWVPLALAAVYAAAGVLAALPGAARGGHRLHHAVGSGAMVYMAVAAAGSARGAAGHGGMAMGSGVPWVTALLALYFTGYVLLSGARLMAVVPAGAAVEGARGPAPRLRNAPEVVLACRVSMALGMLAMLLLM
jgi:hypothetical protein